MSGMFEKVRDHILTHVVRYGVAPGEVIPSVRALADDVSASPLTVQKAIASLVKEGILRTKVGSGTFLVRTPDHAGKMIGIVMPAYESGGKAVFQGEIVRGIESILNLQDYRGNIIQCHGDDPAHEELAIIRDVLVYKVRGLIVNLVSPHDYPVWEELERCNIPVVCVNNFGPRNRYSGVSTNNYLGGRLVAEHLMELGHRHIAVALSDCDALSVRERLNGLRDSLAQDGLPEPKIFSYGLGELHDEILGQWESELLAASPRITALFAINDPIAVQMMHRLQARGVRIPEEISVVGFDDNEICQYTRPALTTVRQKAFEIGRRAATLLLERLYRDNDEEINELLLKPQLIRRDSSGSC